MIQSLYQIDLVHASGTFRLLNIGDIIADEIAFPVTNKASEFTATGAAWAEGIMEGGASCDVQWQRYLNHASHTALRTYCQTHGYNLPRSGVATLQITISNPGGSNEVWERAAARLLSASPMPATNRNGWHTLTSYRVTCGKLRPLSIIATYSGIPITWLNQPITALTMPITSL